MEAQIESLTHEGRGLTHIDGKAVFVHGALPGERVRLRYTKVRRNYDEGSVTEVLTASPDRVEPKCPHFSICGGCSLQHMETGAQIGMKQGILADVLRKIGQLEPEEWLPPIAASHWGYRRKARIGVRYVPKKGRVLVGFRERGTSYVADLGRCEVLHPRVGAKVQAIADMLDGLSIRERVPQIEIAMGDGPCVLVFRFLAAPSEGDLERLRQFGEAHDLRMYGQEGGVETIQPLFGEAVDLHYGLPEYAVGVHFEPTDFTQVNLELNRLMVDQAIALLDPGPGERVLDLFCGLGNFTLPLARRADEVVGVEGDEGLVARARRNAAVNGISNARFLTADLYGDPAAASWSHEHYDKALLDPPRTGALQVIDLLPAMGVRRLVYVSCSPSTLARDADRLVNALGYRLLAAGAMDMFPHTAHVESMAVFAKW